MYIWKVVEQNRKEHLYWHTTQAAYSLTGSQNDVKMSTLASTSTLAYPFICYESYWEI